MDTPMLRGVARRSSEYSYLVYRKLSPSPCKSNNTFGPMGPPPTPLSRSDLAHLQLLTSSFYRVAFTSYGAFWLSFATLFIPGSGIAAAYKAAPAAAMEENAIGIFLMAWMVLTLLFL